MSLRRAAAEVDPARPIVETGIVVRALNGRVREQVSYVGALGVFGVVATMLAAIGVYGVTAFATATRTREIAIRRALGAERRAIVFVIARRTMGLVAVGAAAGLAAAAALTPLVESQLVGVRPLDPATFAAAAALLGGVAAVAGALPVRRALAVAPAVVLRGE
jgi:ABC-type antimicrobial peptide transport system permease subunit